MLCKLVLCRKNVSAKTIKCTPKELASKFQPQRFARGLVASGQYVYEVVPEYICQDNPSGVGDNFGEILDPFGPELLCSWGLDDKEVLPKKFLRRAPNPGQRFIKDGVMYEAQGYNKHLTLCTLTIVVTEEPEVVKSAAAASKKNTRSAVAATKKKTKPAAAAAKKNTRSAVAAAAKKNTRSAVAATKKKTKPAAAASKKNTRSAAVATKKKTKPAAAATKTNSKPAAAATKTNSKPAAAAAAAAKKTKSAVVAKAAAAAAKKTKSAAKKNDDPECPDPEATIVDTKAYDNYKKLSAMAKQLRAGEAEYDEAEYVSALCLLVGSLLGFG